MKFEGLEHQYIAQIALIEASSFELPWTEGMLEAEAKDANSFYKVGLEGDEVVCYGGFRKVLDEAHINNIAVKEEYRRQGIGKRLMAELVRLAKDNGVRYMTLEVRDSNEAAINLYKGFGFEVKGVRKRYYDNRFDALIMWLDLGRTDGQTA